MTASFACLYLHGFLSSPQSKKAQQIQHFFSQHLPSSTLSIPALPFAPKEAIEVAEDELLALMNHHQNVLIIGSSLGGFYATHLSQKHGVKAALVNPAVKPYELFAQRLGWHQHYYDGHSYELKAEHLEQLKQLDSPTLPQPELLFLLLQTGDETLDYRHAAQRYLACQSWLESGGSHSFNHFTAQLPMLLTWANPEHGLYSRL